MDSANPSSPAPLTLKKSELPPPLQRTVEIQNHGRLQVYHEMKAEAERKVIQTLFVLNAGTLAAVVTRAASHNLSHDLRMSLLFSSLGIFLLLVRAAWSYYRAEFGLHGSYSKDMEAFDNDQLTLAELDERDRGRSKRSHPLHLLALLSALLWAASFSYGILDVLNNDGLG